MITNVKNLIKSVDFKFALFLSLITVSIPYITFILLFGNYDPIILLKVALNVILPVILISLVVTALILKGVRSIAERGYKGKKHYLFPLLIFTPTPILLILTVLLRNTTGMEGWGFVIVLVGIILYVPANIVYTIALTLRIRHILRPHSLIT